jgi:hypothetical protein
VSAAVSGAAAIPPPTPIPPPPADPADLDPLLQVWPAGQRLHRCYDVNWGARQFYAGDPAHRGRFHPFTPAGSTSPVEMLYGADDLDGALSETVFHDVPVRGAKRVPHAKLVHRLVVELTALRDLLLADLTSAGLSRLGLSRPSLIESDARSYPDTAAWARALHAHPARVDGLLWVSRQHDTSRALVLFGDRVDLSVLEAAPDAVPLTLGAGAGLDAVCAAATRAGITVTGLPS